MLQDSRRISKTYDILQHWPYHPNLTYSVSCCKQEVNIKKNLLSSTSSCSILNLVNYSILSYLGLISVTKNSSRFFLSHDLCCSICLNTTHFTSLSNPLYKLHDHLLYNSQYTCDYFLNVFFPSSLLSPRNNYLVCPIYS